MTEEEFSTAIKDVLQLAAYSGWTLNQILEALDTASEEWTESLFSYPEQRQDKSTLSGTE